MLRKLAILATVVTAVGFANASGPPVIFQITVNAAHNGIDDGTFSSGPIDALDLSAGKAFSTVWTNAGINFSGVSLQTSSVSAHAADGVATVNQREIYKFVMGVPGWPLYTQSGGTNYSVHAYVKGPSGTPYRQLITYKAKYSVDPGAGSSETLQTSWSEAGGVLPFGTAYGWSNTVLPQTYDETYTSGAEIQVDGETYSAVAVTPFGNSQLFAGNSSPNQPAFTAVSNYSSTTTVRIFNLAQTQSALRITNVDDRDPSNPIVTVSPDVDMMDISWTFNGVTQSAPGRYRAGFPYKFAILGLDSAPAAVNTLEFAGTDYFGNVSMNSTTVDQTQEDLNSPADNYTATVSRGVVRSGTWSAILHTHRRHWAIAPDRTVVIDSVDYALSSDASFNALTQSGAAYLLLSHSSVPGVENLLGGSVSNGGLFGWNGTWS